MRVEFSVFNFKQRCLPQAKQFEELLTNVLSSHPFDKNFFWSKYGDDIRLSVVVYTGSVLPAGIPGIDDDNFPKIILQLRVCDYVGEYNPLLDSSNIQDVSRNSDQRRYI